MKLFALALGTLLASQVAFAASQTFKMYDKPHANPSPSCDVYTKAVLDVKNGVGGVTLSNHVSGTCEIAVFENKRSYNLVLQENDGCGTDIYTQDEDADEAIEVIDNRARLCENVIPGLIVIKEAGQTLYSKDR